MIMPFLSEPMVKTVLGAKRWIRFGPVSIAPVEFFKIGFVFFVAWSFSRKIVHHGKLALRHEFKILLPYLVVFALAVVLIAIFQKDLGQTVVLAVTLMVLIMMAGRSIKLFFLFFLFGFAAFVTLILIAPPSYAAYQKLVVYCAG
jgi:cell division protein FtsW